ncbi:hypothetical protein LOTGIDRAFT_231021 [Lottia gigantea]|uniref:Cyclic nucleotide-binding domain-containing protein n=1 Tax=Lottia gigantea TaxID=225164 RepID=V4B1D3_LOTGI|nr:hypothetical protein LOTGIDRAFT_231021 [Lottia gigantea]ESP00112.1 hypothetical protein LOTGIDRAFT_231021 [Lottia gigantea]
MSVYLPSLDSYSIIEPELFIEDKRSPSPGRKASRDFVTDPDLEQPSDENEESDASDVETDTTLPQITTGSSFRPEPLQRRPTHAEVFTLPPIEENGGVETSGTVSTTPTPSPLNEPSLNKSLNSNQTHRVRFLRHSKSIDFTSLLPETNQLEPEVDMTARERRRMRRSHSLFHVLKPINKQYIPNPQKARERFYKVVRKLMIVKVVERCIAQKSDAGDKPSTLNQLTQVDDTLEENLRNQGLSFDPSYFKAKREINISSEVKHILSLEKEQRTPEQIQTAMFGLQSLRSFAEYPLHMQEKLCKVAIYEVVPPKRVLIRQGHHAENFYFILSGQAVVTILVKDPKTGESVNRVATIMRKGMSFGELALLHHSRRTATVSSQDTVQMLTIGREDFFDIFMAGSGPGQIPDHIKFVSQLDFMKNWPIDRLVENSQHCLLHFFKRNVVIVKDSRVNDWLYVVKSGSCQVMKMLKGVTARTSLSKKDVKMDDSWELPNLPTAEQEAKVDTGRKKKRKEDLTEEQLFRRSMCKSAKEERDRKKGERMSAKYRSPRIMKSAHPNLAPTKPGNVFVQVEHLKPRDVFGLPSIQFDDDIAKSETSVSLVSRGAECIMVSKEFYVKHANEQVKKLIRQQVRPYPAEETFQENLQIKTDWEYYKQAMVGEITEELRSESRSSC